MSTVPMENLELRAYEQRMHLHDRAAELKQKVDEKRYEYSLTNQSRLHFRGAALAASVAGLLLGYVFTGLFTGR